MTTALPVAVRPRVFAIDGVIALPVAPVSHNALVGTGVGGGVGGLAGPYAAVKETPVTIRLTRAECFTVNAENGGGFRGIIFPARFLRSPLN